MDGSGYDAPLYASVESLFAQAGGSRGCDLARAFADILRRWRFGLVYTPTKAPSPSRRILSIQKTFAVKDTVCGLPPPSSLMKTVALKIPKFGGLNSTVMVQDFPAPTLVPQVFVSE